MASYSSSSYRTWRFDVFASFYGGDIRKAVVSYLRRALSDKGISIAIDDEQEMERGATFSPARKQTIRESRISIVVLSKNYATSSWSLNELVEILECKDYIGQIVIPFFYSVDPLDVRRQTGDFGHVFKKTCEGKTEEERRR
ncbi:Disease resistance protein RML1A [Cardamine amara subsp. amara]|uniref:Disease resistance protein RML1A n=1 Tax=Cardamine amara subsp. amara TaxID=228776 RepID=A0ABD0ZSN7_CARAN